MFLPWTKKLFIVALRTHKLSMWPPQSDSTTWVVWHGAMSFSLSGNMNSGAQLFDSMEFFKLNSLCLSPLIYSDIPPWTDFFLRRCSGCCTASHGTLFVVIEKRCYFWVPCSCPQWDNLSCVSGDRNDIVAGGGAPLSTTRKQEGIGRSWSAK